MMLISVYDWMKNNESRLKKIGKNGKRKVKSEAQKITRLKNNQESNSLDLFVNKDNQDKIYDNEFSKEDFLKLTKKWKEENLEN